MRSVTIVWGGEKEAPPLTESRMEIWGFNYAFSRAPWRDWSEPPFTRYFHLHTRDFLKAHEPEAMGYFIRWAESQRHIPIYTLEPWPELIRNEIFPVAKVEALSARGWYHAGSFDWLICYAYLEGFKRIVLPGNLELTRGTEPLSARPCLEHWIGFVEAKGVQVVTPKESDVFSIQHVVRSQSQYGTDTDFRNVVYG